ncbi:hypothetical protein O3P69_000777 [Scylla paramamosain]|uniref:Uncharacterized protein n=1 Tax=Scylla paramamosain TaxID=85552 RepID=A0AAW0USM5_SCYPA
MKQEADFSRKQDLVVPTARLPPIPLSSTPSLSFLPATSSPHSSPLQTFALFPSLAATLDGDSRSRLAASLGDSLRCFARVRQASAGNMGAGAWVLALVWVCWAGRLSNGLEVSTDDHFDYKFDTSYIAMKKAASGINIPNPDMLVIYGLEAAGVYYAAMHGMSYLAYQKLSSNTTKMYAAVLKGECITLEPGDHGRCLTEQEFRVLMLKEARMSLQTAATLTTEAGVLARLQWFMENGVDDIVSIISTSAQNVIRDLFFTFVGPVQNLWFRIVKFQSILVNRYTSGTGATDKLVWTADAVASELTYTKALPCHSSTAIGTPGPLEYAVTWIFKMRKEVRDADKKEFDRVLEDLYAKLVAGETEDALEFANHFLSKSMDRLGPKVFSRYMEQPMHNEILRLSVPLPPNLEDTNPLGVPKSQYESEVSPTENMIHHYLDEAAEESVGRLLFDHFVSVMGDGVGVSRWRQGVNGGRLPLYSARIQQLGRRISRLLYCILVVGTMLIERCAFVVVAVVVVSLVCAAEQGRDEDSGSGNKTEGSTRKRRSYGDDLFSWNYEKVEVASRGWKAHDLREKLMPVVLKIGGTVYTSLSATLNVKSYVNAATKVATRTMNENEHFKPLCASGNLTGITPCTVGHVVLKALSLSTGVTGAITEAYVRTRLNSSIETFRIITDGVFMLITEAVSTELVMLGHFIKMAQNFGSTLAARYFKGPLTVKGTEKAFVKACDNLYAAGSDFFLMSRMVIEHTLGRVSKEINSTTADLAPQFLKYFKNITKRGITEEYTASPFPPLSYFWDMAALEYAVSVLTDMSVIANQTLNEAADESGEDTFVKKAYISNVAYAASAGLNDTAAHLKNDELKAALDSATNGLRMAVYAYHEAGHDIPNEQGPEALLDNLESFMESLRPSSEVGALVDVDKLRSASGVASAFGVADTMELSYRELFSFFVPTDLGHLVTMVTELSKVIPKAYNKYFVFRVMGAPRIVKRQAYSSDPSYDSKSNSAPGGAFAWAKLMSSLAPSGPPGLQGRKFKEMIKIVLKHGNVQFLYKMQEPAACEADPECRETFGRIATEIGKVMGVDIRPGSVMPLSAPIKGGKRTYG